MKFPFAWLTLCWVLMVATPLPSSATTPAEASSVFKALVKAIGDRKVPPTFKIDPDGSGVAEYAPLYNQVTLSSKFLAFADGFGENADAVVALVLGHELAHVYENHNLRATTAFAPQSRIKADKDFARQSLEAEADYFAVYFAYMAGYKTEGLDEIFLRKLYAGFQIEESGHYPPLEKRVEIYRQAREEIGQLIQVFEAGNVLLLTGQPGMAAHCFEQVGTRFPGPEVWNNAGVSYLLAAITLLPESSHASLAAFPIGFEEEMLPPNPSTSKRQATLAPEEAAALRLNFLLLASESFDKAILYGNQSNVATLNLACTYLLLCQEEILEKTRQEWFDFQLAQCLERVLFLSPDDSATTGNVQVLKGIKAWLLKDEAAATQYFTDAATNYGNFLGEMNLNKLNSSSTSHFIEMPSTAFETLHGIALFLPSGRKTLENKVANAGSVAIQGMDFDLTIRRQTMADGEAVLINSFQQTLSVTTTLYVLHAGTGYQGNSAEGIKPGDTEGQLTAKYGHPAMVLQSRCKRYWAYPKAGVIFCLTKGKVTEIFNFFVRYEE
ncbi:MAG: hypothetical protein KDD27_24290 [Saprospiraceae bacterium]|nr:hypothetical protein [Saprospiraceae bacterium]